jgi:tetratricopeptide (TPR) repeat protein
MRCLVVAQAACVTFLVVATILFGVGIPAHAQTDEIDTGCAGIGHEETMLAMHEMHEGRTSAALAYANKALALNPHCMSAYGARGHALMEAASFDAAVADFTHVVNAHPEYPLPYYLRGIANVEGRHPNEAIADFNRALATGLSMGDENWASLLARRSIALELLGKQDLALADLQAAMRSVYSVTHDWDVLDEHCFSATIVGLLDMAQLTCDESVTRHSRNIRIYNARGYLDIKRGNWDQAIADYTQSLYYRPRFPASLYGRAIARQAKGDMAGAATDMAAARAAEPDIVAIMARYGVPPRT